MELARFTRGLDYGAIVTASERVAWTVDAVFRDRGFVAARPIVPDAWVGTHALDFLGENEQRVLNHCRAFSYVHLLGNFEEFAPPHVADVAGGGWHDDRARLRALLRFGDEEMKHQQLLRRAEVVLEASCGHPFDRWFDDDRTAVTALTESILAHPILPRFLMLLAFEWGTQRHYVESIGHQAGGGCDPLYADVLRAHWIEEAQHTKTDTLEIARLARDLGPDDRAAAFHHVQALGALVDGAFAGQAAAEIATLRRVTGRSFSAGEASALQETLRRSLAAIMAGVGLSHPRFVAIARALSADGAARLGLA